MTYSDFVLDTVISILAVIPERTNLFGSLTPLEVPLWLRTLLDRGQRQVLLSEKARSEFLVVPLLLACEDLRPGSVTIYSGVRLDMDAERGLIGECDFILAPTPPLPALRAPLVAIVEAKKQDIEAGTWQCVAQTVGARLFNERANTQQTSVFGCVTTGENWQFLRLKDNVAAVDTRRYYIDNPGGILAVFQRILADSP
jgi:hypothetical protein